MSKCSNLLTYLVYIRKGIVAARKEEEEEGGGGGRIILYIRFSAFPLSLFLFSFFLFLPIFLPITAAIAPDNHTKFQCRIPA